MAEVSERPHLSGVQLEFLVPLSSILPLYKLRFDSEYNLTPGMWQL